MTHTHQIDASVVAAAADGGNWTYLPSRRKEGRMEETKMEAYIFLLGRFLLLLMQGSAKKVGPRMRELASGGKRESGGRIHAT